MQTIKGKMKKFFKRGDTIIEVTIALTVFSLVSVLTIQLMDRDVAIIQGALEYEMARNEIDAQAEALRFIQNSYLSEREFAKTERQFEKIWLKLSRDPSVSMGEAGTGLSNKPSDISQFSSVECRQYYQEDTGQIHSLFQDRAFVINTRKLDPTEANLSKTIIQSRIGLTKYTDIFTEAKLYPRIIYSRSNTENSELTLSENHLVPSGGVDNASYNKVARVEGIWVIAARSETQGTIVDTTPEFYDFHIRTCWFAPGHDRPSTIATTIRLYNPELIEDQR